MSGSEGLSDKRKAFYQNLFKEFDADGSGSISKLELGAAMSRQGGKTVDDEKVSQMIAEVDDDGSGEVEFEEFCTMMRKVHVEAPEVDLDTLEPMAGYMLKEPPRKKVTTGKWRKRWFIVDNDNFRYYEDDSVKKLIKTVEWKVVTNVKQGTLAQILHIFTNDKRGSFVLRTDDEELRDQWFEAIRNRGKLFNDGDGPLEDASTIVSALSDGRGSRRGGKGPNFKVEMDTRFIEGGSKLPVIFKLDGADGMTHFFPKCTPDQLEYKLVMKRKKLIGGDKEWRVIDLEKDEDGNPTFRDDMSAVRGYQHCWFVREKTGEPEDKPNAIRCEIWKTENLGLEAGVLKGGLTIDMTMKRNLTEAEMEKALKKAQKKCKEGEEPEVDPQKVVELNKNSGCGTEEMSGDQAGRFIDSLTLSLPKPEEFEGPNCHISITSSKKPAGSKEPKLFGEIDIAGDDIYNGQTDYLLEDESGSKITVKVSRIYDVFRDGRWKKQKSAISACPDLFTVLQKIPLLKKPLQGIPKDKREIIHMPCTNSIERVLKGAILALEGFIPRNCWDLKCYLDNCRGMITDNVLYLTKREKTMNIIEDKQNDPKIQFMLRKKALEVPIIALRKGLEQIKISLDKIFPDIMGVFFPKPPVPPARVKAVEKLESDPDQWRYLEGSVAFDVNTMQIYAPWMGGIRVRLPGAAEMRAALRSIAPQVSEGDCDIPVIVRANNMGPEVKEIVFEHANATLEVRDFKKLAGGEGEETVDDPEIIAGEMEIIALECKSHTMIDDVFVHRPEPGLCIGVIKPNLDELYKWAGTHGLGGEQNEERTEEICDSLHLKKELREFLNDSAVAADCPHHQFAEIHIDHLPWTEFVPPPEGESKMDKAKRLVEEAKAPLTEIKCYDDGEMNWEVADEAFSKAIKGLVKLAKTPMCTLDEDWQQMVLTREDSDAGNFECGINLKDGVIAYRMIVDGVKHYDPGNPIEETPDMEKGSFKYLRVTAKSVFGVGIDVGL